jgi:hypothetical protein
MSFELSHCSELKAQNSRLITQNSSLKTHDLPLHVDRDTANGLRSHDDAFSPLTQLRVTEDDFMLARRD